MESKLTIDEEGNKKWTLPNGKKHREDGPAMEWCEGAAKFWLINGKYHRENGPAVEYPNDTKLWYLNGTRYSEQEYKLEMRNIKLKKLLG
ncbi:hypothetical protein P700755_002395 [Psychroflexus torquis ATCC 700755]|uniref:Uncharacterized protein n=1 Tax=Psychroflexus torquis (strain ATCC 700755 / CIP 106069 / ACAM 623) TaxID=313595 RepID=K4IFK8_PSYTT|nr:hypothetical protein [Psychroflexus torquis]AFU69169.1 hypothetical protein P700755_002395 [Psychroflexus torquis ATCC 700755]